MKKILVTVGFVIGFGVFSTNSITMHASAAESDQSSVVIQDQAKEQINDPSPLTWTITKLSDDPYIMLPMGVMPMGAGVWDPIGEDTFLSKSKTFYSGGGDLKIIFTQYTYNGTKYLYKLLEEDPLWDWTVSEWEGPAAKGVYEITFSGVSDLVDGDNNKAELHMEKLTYPTEYVYTRWFD